MTCPKIRLLSRAFWLVKALLLVAVPVQWAEAREARGWITTADASRKLEPFAVMPIGPASDSALPVIAVERGQRFQPVAGFGASITDASAWLLNRKLTPRARRGLVREMFGRGQDRLGLSLTRLTIGASDFSLRHYSYRDDPALRGLDFSPARADVIPVTRLALTANPRLMVFASPWSAPGWMKTSGSMIRGELKPEYHAEFARYLSDYVTGMGRLGVPVRALTLQNEPHFEPTDYPGMRLSSAQRAALVGQAVGPLFAREHPRVRLLEWDHNWDQPEAPMAVLSDPQAARYLAGVAWHCYAGDVSAQGKVHAAFPAKEVWFTECSGGGWAPEFGKTLGWMAQNLIIGTLRNQARGVILWNIALDENGGPHLGGCGNCRGVVTIDSKSGAITRNVEYYVLGHASRFAGAGAVRIASSTGVEGLDSVALLNRDGSVALIVYNGSGGERRFAVRDAGRSFTAALPAGALATYVWGRR